LWTHASGHGLIHDTMHAGVPLQHKKHKKSKSSKDARSSGKQRVQSMVQVHPTGHCNALQPPLVHVYRLWVI
jgi:hypothetical protein